MADKSKDSFEQILDRINHYFIFLLGEMNNKELRWERRENINKDIKKLRDNYNVYRQDFKRALAEIDKLKIKIKKLQS